MRAQRLMIVGVASRARRKPRVRTGRPRRLAVADGARRMRSARRGCAPTTRSRCRRCRSPASNCSGQSKLDEPAARRARSRTGRDSERRDAVRADVARDRQLEQRLRHRQRPRLRRLGAAVRRRAPRTDSGLSRRDQRWRHAHREARRNGLELSWVRRRARSGRLSQPGRRARARRAGRRAGGRRGTLWWRSVACTEQRRARRPRRWPRCCSACATRAATGSGGAQRPGRTIGFPDRRAGKKVRREHSGSCFGPPASAT